MRCAINRFLYISLGYDDVVFQCGVGSVVNVRVGGDFYFQPTSDSRNLLLIAGGIGINPIWSIVQETLEMDRQSNLRRFICVLYSAKTTDELVFLVRVNNTYYCDQLGNLFSIVSETTGEMSSGQREFSAENLSYPV